MHILIGYEHFYFWIGVCFRARFPQASMQCTSYFFQFCQPPQIFENSPPSMKLTDLPRDIVRLIVQFAAPELRSVQLVSKKP